MVNTSDATHSTTRKLVLAALFGLIFGFLIQKGGAAKFHVLIGVLLLKDFTVVKVMLSAVVVGMLGFFFLKRQGTVDLHPKPLILGAVITGGLLFGIGFAFSGYCPGTAAAALGQGNGDALFSIAGLLVGSYLYAIASGWIGRTFKRWGDCGKPLLPSFIGMQPGTFAVGFAVILIGLLVLLEQFTIR